MKKKLELSKVMKQQIKDYGAITKTAMDMGDIVVIRHVDAELLKVIKNTKTEWCAKYADNYGRYKFSLKKKGDKYFIESDGVKFDGYSDLDKVVWNYESQLEQVRRTALVIKENTSKRKIL